MHGTLVHIWSDFRRNGHPVFGVPLYRPPLGNETLAFILGIKRAHWGNTELSVMGDQLGS